MLTYSVFMEVMLLDLPQSPSAWNTLLNIFEYSTHSLSIFGCHLHHFYFLFQHVKRVQGYRG